MTNDCDITPPADRPAATIPSRRPLPPLPTAAQPAPRRLVSLAGPITATRQPPAFAYAAAIVGLQAERTDSDRQPIFAADRDRLPRNGSTIPAVASHQRLHRSNPGT